MSKLKNRIHVLGILLVMLPLFPHAQTISPQRLLEVIDLSNPVISPDGRYVAFRAEQASVERNTYDTTWYVQALDGKSPPLHVADGGVPLRGTAGLSLPATVVWSPDGRWIYYRALIDGQIDVWRAAADGSGASPVTRDAADTRRFILSTDGRTLTYSTDATRAEIRQAEQDEYDRGIRIDKTVPIGAPLFRSSYIKGRLATQRYTGLWFDRAGLLAAEPDHWKALDLETRAARDLMPSDRPSSPLAPSDLKLARGVPEPWRLSLDSGTGRIVLLTRVNKPDVQPFGLAVQLAMLPNRTASKPILCVAKLCKNKAISGVQWRPGSDEVLFTVTDPTEGLAQSIYSWNVQTGVVRLVVRAKGFLSGGRYHFYKLGYIPCGLSSMVLVCVTAAADQPPRLERIDLESGKRHVLFDPNEALAMDMAKVPVHLLRWKDKQGRWFTGQFYPARRSGSGPAPLFITYYSCPGFVRGGVGDEWPLVSLAQVGISALCINYFVPMPVDAVERYNQALSAVKSVVDLLASQGKIDQTRAGMGGLSLGSDYSLWVAMKSDLLAAVSVTSPSVSPIYYLFNRLKGESFTTGIKEIWKLGSPEVTPEQWQALSPTYNVDKFHAPILFQTPEQEYLHSLDYVMPLLLDQRADMYVFPNEPHQKFQPKHKLAAYDRNLDWFRFWLQSYEDPDPGKQEQYAHWRTIREHVCARSAKKASAAPWYCRLVGTASMQGTSSASKPAKTPD